MDCGLQVFHMILMFREVIGGGVPGSAAVNTRYGFGCRRLISVAVVNNRCACNYNTKHKLRDHATVT